MATLGRYSYQSVLLAGSGSTASYGIVRFDSAYGKYQLVATVLGSEGLAITYADRLTQTEPDYVL